MTGEGGRGWQDHYTTNSNAYKPCCVTCVIAPIELMDGILDSMEEDGVM